MIAARMVATITAITSTSSAESGSIAAILSRQGTAQTSAHGVTPQVPYGIVPVYGM